MSDYVECPLCGERMPLDSIPEMDHEVLYAHPSKMSCVWHATVLSEDQIEWIITAKARARAADPRIAGLAPGESMHILRPDELEQIVADAVKARAEAAEADAVKARAEAAEAEVGRLREVNRIQKGWAEDAQQKEEAAEALADRLGEVTERAIRQLRMDMPGSMLVNYVAAALAEWLAARKGKA